MSVTVIIPCFNSEKYISATLHSVLKQTYSSIEIICVDNGSSDNTITILNEFAAQHSSVKVLFQALKGAANARNMGLAYATGKFIQFLDSDDEIEPQKILEQVAYLESTGFDLVVSDRAIYNETLETKIEEINFAHILQNPLSVAISEIIITGNPLYRKSAIEKISGYNTALRVAQDWDFHIRLFLSTNKIGYLAGTFLKSRRLENSLSSNWIEVSNTSIQVIESLRDILFEKKLDHDKSVFKKVVHLYLNSCFAEKNSATIKKYRIEIKRWSSHFSVTECLSKANRLLYKTVGLAGYIKIKSKLLGLENKPSGL